MGKLGQRGDSTWKLLLSSISERPCASAEIWNDMGGRMGTPVKAAGIKKAGAGCKKATAGNGKEAGKKKKAAAVRKKASRPRIKEPTRTDKSSSNTNEGKSLGEEAFSVMGAQASKIIERLLMQAMKGDMKSAQMLLNLANKEGEAKEALRHGPLRSQALAWAAELPWQDEVDPKQGETGSGSREAG
jgi:hypothetical protein